MSPFLIKTICSSRIVSILSFCVEVKVKGVEVSIGSLEEELGGISKGSSRIVSILSFCVEVKVKGVEVSIGSLEEELGGISKGLFEI
jgi:hypothetical protein